LWWRAESVESRQPFKRKVDEPILEQLQLSLCRFLAACPCLKRCLDRISIRGDAVLYKPVDRSQKLRLAKEDRAAAQMACFTSAARRNYRADSGALITAAIRLLAIGVEVEPRRAGPRVAERRAAANVKTTSSAGDVLVVASNPRRLRDEDNLHIFALSPWTIALSCRPLAGSTIQPWAKGDHIKV
jgi:hypothetical protein